MLVLTRKNGESIQIGDNITIKVIRADRNQVRLGIDALEEVRILRSELCRGQRPRRPDTQQAGSRLAYV